MKFTYSWLKEYLDTNKNPLEIANSLSAIGLEVEDMIDTSKALSQFIIGEIIEVKDHPNADSLHLLTVDSGSEKLQIVCGAINVRVGLKGILARVGDIMPDTGKKLKKGKIRGEESQGMMCSLRELGLGEDHDGILDLHANVKAKAGENASVILSQIYPIDTMFDAEVTPNRADYLGVKGIAIDLNAAGMGKYKAKEIPTIKGSFESPVKVQIKDKDLCPMFTGMYIKGIKNCESPKWLKEKLLSIGLNPISALVDITNYLCFDMARPLHVFDADKLNGDLVIRAAKAGEKLSALDENEYEFTSEDIVISDNKEVVSLAGVMGGMDTGCTESTTNVFLESALFNPINIRKTAAKLKIQSDAKFRFERYVDPKSTLEGLQLAAKLITEICGGEVSKIVQDGSEPKCEFEIVYPISAFEKLIGIEVPTDEMIKILEELGCKVSHKKDELHILTPSHRGDLKEVHDITEEIIRIYGYEKIPLVAPEKKPMISQTLSPMQKRISYIKRLLASRGMDEVLTFEFSSSELSKAYGLDKNEVRVANPITPESDVMRRSLLPNMITAVGKNIKRGYSNLAFFEQGPIFFGSNPGEQSEYISGIRSGLNYDKHWNETSKEVDIFDIKDDVLSILKECGLSEEKVQLSTDNLPKWVHPYRAANIMLGKFVIGTFGQVHPLVLKAHGIKNTKLVAFEIDMEKLPVAKKAKSLARKKYEVSNLQRVSRDFAFVVEKHTPASNVVKSVRNADKTLITDVNVFDVYDGVNLSGKKSIALSVALTPIDHTLTDKEIEEVSNKIIASVEKVTGGKLR